jgi:transcriptional regulator with XRE-family HTH domain
MQFEQGISSPSLPQLEMLAYFFKVPLNSLLKPAEVTKRPGIDPSAVSNLLALRDRIISAILKQKRLENGMEIDELADKANLSPESIYRYENDQAAIPQTTLEKLCKVLDVSLNSLFSSISVENQPISQETLKDNQPQLPDEVSEFIANENNIPYLELAKKLSRMDAARIREIAESLLEITY